MKYAKEVMTPNPLFIQSGEDLINALDLFIKKGIHFAPVVTPMGEVLGMLSEVAMLKASMRRYLDPDKRVKVYDYRDLLEEATFVEETTSFDDVVKAMMKSKTKRVLVLNKHKQMVGILAPRDLLSMIHGTHKTVKNLQSEMLSAQEQTLALQAKIKELHQLKDRYKQIFENSPYMIHGVNNKGVIVMANAKIHEVLEYNPGELIGKTIADLYPENIIPLATLGLQNIIEKGSHTITYTTMFTKHRDKKRVDIASAALKDTNNNFLSTISITREIESDAMLRALHGIVDVEEGYADKK